MMGCTRKIYVDDAGSRWSCFAVFAPGSKHQKSRSLVLCRGLRAAVWLRYGYARLGLRRVHRNAMYNVRPPGQRHARLNPHRSPPSQIKSRLIILNQANHIANGLRRCSTTSEQTDAQLHTPRAEAGE